MKKEGKMKKKKENDFMLQPAPGLTAPWSQALPRVLPFSLLSPLALIKKQTNHFC